MRKNTFMGFKCGIVGLPNVGKFTLEPNYCHTLYSIQIILSDRKLAFGSISKAVLAQKF